MNKRRRKKAALYSQGWTPKLAKRFRRGKIKWVEEPLDVGFSAWKEGAGRGEWGPSLLVEMIRGFERDIARVYGVPARMLFGHRLGGYAPPQLLIGWDGPQ